MMFLDLANPSKVTGSAWTGSGPSPSAHLTLERLLQVGVPITYLAGVFPKRSETFVYREVRELRHRGWNVTAVSLNESPDERRDEFQDLARALMVVYGSGSWQTLIGFVNEMANHPIAVCKTLFGGIVDAISPGEPMGWLERLKVFAGSAAGVGLAGRLRGDGTRHIHCHFAHAPTTVGMYAAQQLGVTFSFAGHANDLFQRRVLLTRKLERAAFVACISNWHRELFRELVPGDDEVYPIVRCGVDLKAWNRSGDRQKSGDENFRILTVCRLVEKKGVDALIRAVGTSSNWKLTVAGEGPEFHKLQQLTWDLGLRERVEFLGAVGNERVAELMKSADVFALPCRTDSHGDRDGIPVVLVEAMASGVPVISGDLPAIRELVERGVAGLLVNPDEPNEVAEALRKLADDSELRERLASAGRLAVEREFDLPMNVSRLEKMFEKWVELGPRPRSISKRSVTETAKSNGTEHPCRRYALITPCRDEAQYARRTLDSVTRQTIPPALWVIVDDGSTDETPRILAEYAERFPYIKIITRPDRGERKLGGGVIDAFYAGYEAIDPGDYEYVCKLDLDLELPHRYFETLMERMEANPRIGTCSGKPYYVRDGKLISEMCGDEHSVGMIKFYRTDCFQQIGGFVRELMWDGIDGHRCRMKGWLALSWDDREINFEHLRPMGSSDKSWWTGRVRHGVGQYFMGTGLIYMLASSVFRMTRPPVLVGGLAMLWGYLKCAVQHRPRYPDAEFQRFLRTYQRDCLMRGKKSATVYLNSRQASAWNPRGDNTATVVPAGRTVVKA
jgi:poly-beta-1,6-N-acetyl-D-glucosamine synthase